VETFSKISAFNIFTRLIIVSNLDVFFIVQRLVSNKNRGKLRKKMAGKSEIGNEEKGGS
jgi:hypothetical protein